MKTAPVKDRLIKLGDALRKIGNAFDQDSIPKRGTVIAMIEEGSLSGIQLGKGKNYYIYQSSLETLMNSLSNEKAAA